MEHVIGIDVSKAHLDLYDLASGGRLAVGNDAAAIAALTAQLGRRRHDRVVMEVSGV